MDCIKIDFRTSHPSGVLGGDDHWIPESGGPCTKRRAGGGIGGKE